MVQSSRIRWWRLLSALLVPVALLLAAAPSGASSASGQPTWATLSPPSSPPPLTGAVAAYDGSNNTIVLFGGAGANGVVSNDTWVFDGSTWTRFQSQFSGPPARSDASLAYDANLHQLLLFGGQGAGGALLGDTWAWNGQSWYPFNVSVAPPARAGASMAVDSRGNLVLFGGTGAPSASTSPTAPATATPSTSTTSSTTTTPSVAASPSAASPGVRVALSDTWRWDGTSWTEAALGAPAPPARTGATLTWDPSIGATVLFGGSASPLGSATPAPLADTWTWDGSAWANVATPTSPPARSGAVSAAAGNLGGVLVFSGSTASGLSAGTWAFDGTTWSQRSTAGTPPVRSGAAGAWDSATRHLVVFGGSGSSGTLGDTVLLAASAPVIATAPTTGSAGGATTTAGGVPTSPTAGGTTAGDTTPGSNTTGGTGSSTTHTSAVAPGATTANPSTTVAGHPVPTTGRGATPAATAASAPTRLPTPGTTVPRATQTVHGGSLVTLLGAGFRPGAVITITFHSSPSTVGRAVADAHGSFAATVSVPARASIGMHHLVAAGIGSAGHLTSLVTPVQVVSFVASPHPGTNPATTAAMIGLAVAIPAGTWVLLGLRSRWRKAAPLP